MADGHLPKLVDCNDHLGSIMKRQPLETTAYHEAGHAVVAWAQGLAVRKDPVAWPSMPATWPRTSTTISVFG